MTESTNAYRLNGRAIDAQYIANHLPKATDNGSEWMACCPAHDDHKPSLSIADTEDGRVLVHCHAGCGQREVIAALKAKNLWPGWADRKQRPSVVVDIGELRSEAKKKFPGSDANSGSPSRSRRQIAATYDYLDENGVLLFQTVRYDPKDFRQRRPDGQGGWIWNLKDTRLVPYRLPGVLKADLVYLVEGEKDVQTLEKLGLTATCNPMGAGKWKPEYSTYLKDKQVVIIPDNDEPGRKHAGIVAQSVHDAGAQCIKVVSFPGAKDVTEWIEAGGTKAQLLEAVKKAPQYEPAAASVPAAGSRPSICLTAPKCDEVVRQCIRALWQRNQSKAVLFTRGHSMVYVARDKRGRTSIAEVEESFLIGELERVADFYKEKDVRRDGQTVQVAVNAWPTVAVAKAILSRPQSEWGLPALDGVVTGPVLGRDWSVQIEPGYNSGLCLYYAPRTRLELPEIPEKPTKEQCSGAMNVIDDVIGQFPWVSEADRANYIALLLTPLLRHRLEGSVPIALLDSPKKGNGKTMLAQILGIVHEGEEPVLWTPPSGENWEKIITTVLLSGQPITVFDNLEGTLSSPVLSKVVTSNMHADRQFHTQKRLVMRNSTMFVITGNNIKLAGDVGRRCYQIRLDAGTSRPWERKEFKHPYVKSYVRAERAAVLAALLTMARAWVAAGKPKLRTRELGGGFEGWSRTVGRILAYAGVKGFLENQERLYEESDVSEGEWVNFLEGLRREYPQGFEISGFVGDLDLASFPKDALPDEPEFAKPDSLRIAGLFRRKRDTRFGREGLRLVSESKRGVAARWFVRGDAQSPRKD